jgi:hypothetical protein
VTVGALLLAAIAASGCGEGAQKVEAQKLERTSVISNTAPLSQRLVSQAEINAASDTSAVRTFLDLWSALQFEEWDRAAAVFDPGLRKALGPAQLIEALESYVLVWQATKPKIVSTRVTGRRAVIAFLERDELGHVLPASISFEGHPGGWRAYYFSPLDGALQRAVQLRVQAQLEPLGTKPNAEAVRQGDFAATLQSAYLARRERATEGGKGAPAGRP